MFTEIIVPPALSDNFIANFIAYIFFLYLLVMVLFSIKFILVSSAYTIFKTFKNLSSGLSDGVILFIKSLFTYLYYLTNLLFNVFRLRKHERTLLAKNLAHALDRGDIVKRINNRITMSELIKIENEILKSTSGLVIEKEVLF